MTSTGFDFMYNATYLKKYIDSLPLWRRILARYFERFRITKKEYDEWFIKNGDRLLGLNNSLKD